MPTTPLANRRILVIGANSFIGGHLVAELTRQQAEVHGTFHRNRANLPSGVRAWPLNIVDPEAVRLLLRRVQPEVIFNLSGYVEGNRNLEHILPSFRINLLGAIHLLMACQEMPCERLVLMGSLEEYQPDPTRLRPVSPYAASKIAASAYGQMFHALYDLPVVITRPFMVYGPEQHDWKKLVPHTITSLLAGKQPGLTSGARQADWIFVADVVAAFLEIAHTPGLEGQILPLGSGRLYTNRQVVETIYRLLAVDTRPVFGALPDRPLETEVAADLEITQQLINWKPCYSLEDGLKITIDGYRSVFLKQ